MLPKLLILAALAPLLSALMMIAIPHQALAAMARPLSLIAIGLLLTIALGHLIPEAMASADAHDIGMVMLLTLLVLITAEMLLSTHRTRHDSPAASPRQPSAWAAGGAALLGGIFVHSVCDGVMLASAYLMDPQLGIALAIAIIMHEIPHELGDFGVLISLNISRSGALAVPLSAVCGAACGVTMGYYVLDTAHNLLPYVTGVAASGFLYVALTDLLPRLSHQGTHRIICWRLFFILSGSALAAVLSHH